MLRHHVTSALLMSHHNGRSYVTLAHSASCRLLIRRSFLPPLGQAFLPRSWCHQSITHLLLVNRHSSSALCRDFTPQLPQHVPWFCTSVRQKIKMTYYGFASRHPKPPSRFAKFYFLLLSLGFISVVCTPL